MLTVDRSLGWGIGLMEVPLDALGGKWWLWIVLSFLLLWFYVELDVLGVTLLHCSVVEMQQNSFRKGTCVFLGLEGEAKPKWKAKIVLGFTMWVWRVCPEHGANTAFWVQLLYPKQQQLQWGQAIPASSVGSFFCFCYGLNLVKVSGLNWATSTEFSQHISLCNVKHDWMLNPNDGYPILAFLYSKRIV